MKLILTPGKPLRGVITPQQRPSLPGDKSLSHRAALFAALAQGVSQIDNFLVSGVTRAMLDALTALEVPWELQGTTLRVTGKGPRQLCAPAKAISCGNSATTLRLLAGALAAAGIGATLDGSDGLRRRPMGRIVDPLQAMGVAIQASRSGTAPLVLQARPAQQPLRPLHYTLPVASAQVKSCLLLAALAAEGQTTLLEPGPSRDHTERILKSMGVDVVSQPPSETQPYYQTQLTPSLAMTLSPLHMRLPGDLSAAAFLIVAALITPGSKITLEGVGLNPTRTGLLDALQQMGALIKITPLPEQAGEPLGNLTIASSALQGTRVGGPLVVRMIDEFPAFAIAAAYAQGETVVADAEELRHKESDRIGKLCQELRLLGVEVEEKPDGFVIHGRPPLHGATVQSHGDHRLAMALSVAGLGASTELTVEGAEIIAESFPHFSQCLQALGAELRQA